MTTNVARFAQRTDTLTSAVVRAREHRRASDQVSIFVQDTTLANLYLFTARGNRAETSCLCSPSKYTIMMVVLVAGGMPRRKRTTYIIINIRTKTNFLYSSSTLAYLPPSLPLTIPLRLCNR